MKINYQSMIVFFLAMLMIAASGNIFPQSSNFPGTALQFNNTGEYVNGTCINTGLTAVTLEAWVYHYSLSTTIQRYITLNNEVAVIRHNNGSPGQLHFYVKKADGNLVSLTANGVLSTDTWTHVAGTYDGTNMKLYCNGVLVASSTPSAGLYPNTGNFTISGSSENMDGIMDELRVWNYARTQQQIRENMHLTLAGNEAGLINYWQLNEGSGTTITDVVNSCTGTFNNMNNADWVYSTVPLGVGVSNTQPVSSTGNVVFTGTGFSSDFTALSGTESFTVSRINLSPNTKPAESYYASTSQYWVVKNYNSQTFTANLTFTLNDNLNSYNFYNPASVKLFRRSENSDGSWTLLSNASSLDTTAKTVTFSNISTSGQFLVLRNYPVRFAGNALEFDGADDYLQLADVSGFQYNGSFTVEAWIKTEVMQSGFHSIIAKGTEWELKMYEGSSFIVVEFGINNNAIFSMKNISSSLVVGKWLHLAGVVNQTAGQKNLVLYVNSEAGTPETPTSVTPSSALIQLGNGFKGVIEEVKIWREARTQQQIREHMHLTPTSADKNLVACLQLNESNGSAATDVAGGNNGTLHNMSASAWLKSTAIVGGGVSATKTEATGNVSFTGTGLTMHFNSHGSATITVSRIDTVSNNNVSFFDSQYWIIHRYGTGSFNTNVTFTVDEDLTTTDQSAPSRIKAFTRASNDDGQWSYGYQASTVDASLNTATFSNLTTFSQFVIGRRLPPDNFSGYALNFEHNNDYITASGLESTIHQFTLEAWVYHNALPTGQFQYYLTIEPDVASILYYGLDPTYPNQLTFDIRDDNFSGYSLRAYNVLSTNNWLHVCATYDGDTMKLYLNGNLMNSMTTGGISLSPNGTFHISGTMNDIFGTTAMDGQLDEIRIWNYERSITDIRSDMYRTLTGRESGLVSYWQFNEGTGAESADLVGGNTGTFTNMTNADWIASTVPVPYISTQTGNWESASTWLSGQGIPVSSWSRVRIANQVQLNNGLSVKDLSITASGILTITPATWLTVTDSLHNANTAAGLVLKSDATGTATLINSNNNVPATVERYYTGAPLSWHFLSSPVFEQDISGDEFTPSGSAYDFFLWSEPTRYWINEKGPDFLTTNGGSDFVAGCGYLTAYQETNPTKHFQGNLTTGNVVISLSNTGTANFRGANLIGNPYPSAIDWKAASGWTRTYVAQNPGGGYDAHFWNDAAGNYGVYNSNSISDGGTNGASRYISVGQGFMVSATNPAGNLTIGNATRVHQNSSFLKSLEQVSNLLCLSVSGDAIPWSDVAMVEFGHASAGGGALKWNSMIEEAPDLFMPKDGKNYSVSFMATLQDCSIPLSFVPGIDGNYSITATGLDSFDPQTIINLEDTKTTQVQNLMVNPLYQFTSTKFDEPLRFILHFGGTFSIAGLPGSIPVHIFTDGSNIYFDPGGADMEKVSIGIYNLLGQEIFNTQTRLNTVISVNVGDASGLCIVTVKSVNMAVSQKLYIK